MIDPRHPVQDRLTEHDVEALTRDCAGELLGARFDEGLVGERARTSLVEQRRLRFEADDMAFGHEAGHGGGEITRATADVEHPVGGAQRERRQEPVVVPAMVVGVGGV